MLDRFARFLFRRLGRRYKGVFMATQIPASVLVAVGVLGLPLSAYPVLLAAGAIAAAYGTIVTYSIAEFFLRPLLESVDPDLPEGVRFSFSGLPLRSRLVLTLPVFTAMTGLVVAAIVRRGGGTGELAIAVAVFLAVGLALSLELTVLLSRAITTPIAK